MEVIPTCPSCLFAAFIIAEVSVMVIGKLLGDFFQFTWSVWWSLAHGYCGEGLLQLKLLGKCFTWAGSLIFIGQNPWKHLELSFRRHLRCMRQAFLEEKDKKIIEYDIFISFLPALWDHHSPIIPLPPYSHMDGCHYCISPKCREQHPMRSTLMVLCKLLVGSTH